MFNSKELRLFVRLCQITGLIPYSIEYDPKTGQFERFSFAWRKFLTWWYVGILVLQGSIAINNTVQVYRSLQTQFSASGTKYLPTAVVILSGSSQLFYFAIVVIVRVTVVRYSRLCKAIQLIREVEQHLQNRRLSNKYDCKNTIAHRAIIGFVLSLLFVRSIKIDDDHNLLILQFPFEGWHVYHRNDSIVRHHESTRNSIRSHCPSPLHGSHRVRYGFSQLELLFHRSLYSDASHYF